jgi:hypothetical protein
VYDPGLGLHSVACFGINSSSVSEPVSQRQGISLYLYQVCIPLCFIPEAQPQTPVKDKSPWRKSNLNVPNSAEETELDIRRVRRIRSRGSMDAGSTSSNPLQVLSLVLA